MRHHKVRFSDGRSWKNPDVVGLYITISLVYIVGLLCFQKYAGLLELNIMAPSSNSPLAWFHTNRHLLSTSFENETLNTSFSPLPNGTYDNKTSPRENGTKFGGGSKEKDASEDEADGALFPDDIFTVNELQHGAVIFYIIGMVYMFVALAIVCDEFFVPSLDVIIEVIGCSEDVAGATFMAAGGSAPELFTSVIGVFVAFSDVGIGTIVGSAVFNILFVIGMCALFSKTVLHLTWWPLFRDCTFYSISLVTLIVFFIDDTIEWYESGTLLGIYFAYVGFMKINPIAERTVKKLLFKNKVTRVRSTDHLVPTAGVTGAAMSGTVAATGEGTRSHTSIPVLHSGSHFRHGLLQLMIHTIDPLHDGKVDEKATQLHAIASLKVLLDATKPQEGTNGTASNVLDLGPDGAVTTAGLSSDEDESHPLDLSWPDTTRERITYILFLPIILPLWLTLPDTRKSSARKYYPITFLGSILWIAAFSYLMVWWATISGKTFDIPPEVMGLTFLAAGTSIPDLITSVIVARKGFGDMAVSSSVGSNIFDVTVGLPFPWLLYSAIFQKPVTVSSAGMVCSITILFGMLLLVFFSILLFNWKMTKGMGLTMFVFYFAFVAVSLGFEKFKDIPLPFEYVQATTGQKLMVDIRGLQNAPKKGCHKIFRKEPLHCVGIVTIPSLENAIGLRVKRRGKNHGNIKSYAQAAKTVAPLLILSESKTRKSMLNLELPVEPISGKSFKRSRLSVQNTEEVSLGKALNPPRQSKDKLRKNSIRSRRGSTSAIEKGMDRKIKQP
ncbi:Sodium/potassium/calcium exchanger 4,Sodium/potassium/calcium exchanger Nckx30C,Sodium/potassium/calcium exchanger 3,Sodium/potassium/calcium exchanger 5,Sodium/potassium/calcium exchanger 2,Sodium/potassium/calcium exchanger 1 [Lepeophtheirus salmonis]|uniref:Sodium/calcium exchanger membrane region domain-containing protein n=1 Tax=Lepeophtheirus salmonis TaxID=72036 RepID=A0A7R8CS48_LEPSM|nr:Sodium/potassium/calcium exchanger 4,Sodium/potassium/calcium exchanger Nckx30C,Sodium/potassium/calcium exchanger 3,Sodium/potassium/calcium exchanger 5,Sodium/potassium/calcium exchanger 2,Sodium/potassium/calcium exchanger 1 [Lepeophtheirus salmonis]CAF2913282.1 Sodium/potassium/calcium exchanger 4,Sodium/potassium/calcium exchanger Nckx30C,Sodium/potassium/calcium exchanger 3,Sodium/potassium/calcium exchanger 5,Sodium/potassium/calcium exchanger 2,Sodium/potassium/calcium exchanger 1 [Lepe